MRVRGRRSLAFAAGAATLTVAVFLQAPGRILPETKLDLVVDPAGFLGRATHLWDGQAAFGQIQNQAAGYLLPMGPVYALGHGLGIPMWIVQRGWITALLLVAGLGTYRLARALRIGTEASAGVAGVAYALSPPLLGLVAFQSGGQVAYAAAPWVMLPLVTGWSAGTARRAAARSGIALALCGGVNATSTLAALVVPAMWLLWRRGGPRARFLAWWAVCIVFATAWWAVPLALQSRYGLDFTRYTETAATTTSTMSVEEAIRGTGNWLGYLSVPGGQWLPGAWRLVSSTAAVLGAAGVVALGLAGLAHRGNPHRRPLVAAAGAAVLAMCAGYGGNLGGPASGLVRRALDGSLAPFRNVFKIEPALWLPIVLGIAHCVGLPLHEPARRPRRVPRLPRRALVAGAALAAVTATAMPVLEGNLAAPGSFGSLPSYWEEAARWVAAHGGDGRTLLVPGSAFAEYSWGRPLDEPMQALARSPWAVRDLIPLGSAGATRLLDAVERVLEEGRPAAGLAEFLGRAGVRFVLARNDLDRVRVDAPAPAQVRTVLRESPGFTMVAGFGSPVAGPSGSTRLEPDRGGAPEGAIEIYEVASSSGRVTVYPSSGMLAVSGGPESLLQLARENLLDGRVSVLAGDAAGIVGAHDRWVASDALARRDVAFGLVRDNRSYVLAAGEPAPGGRAPRDRLPVAGVEHQAVAVQAGAAAIRSSSYATATHAFPEAQPAAAFDGDPASAWVPAGRPSIVGEWLEVDFAEDVAVSEVTVTRSHQRSRYDGRISAIEVTTASGRTRLDFGAGDRATVALPAGTTRWVRLTIAAAEGGGVGPRPAGIAEIDVPGVTIDRWVALPKDWPAVLSGVAPVVLLDRSVADPYEPARSDEETQLRRAVTLPASARFDVSGTVLPVPGPALDALLAATHPAKPADISVTASSTWYDRPAFAAWRAADADPATSWVSSPDDFAPSLTLRWGGAVDVDRVHVVPAGGSTEQIRRMDLSVSGDVVASGPLDGSGDLRFPPVHTNEITISFPPLTPSKSGVVAFRLVGVAEIEVPALAGRAVARPEAASRFEQPCGRGPSLVVDGRDVQFRVEGTVGDLVELAALQLRSCEGPIALTAGEHRIDGAAGGALAVSSLGLVPPGARAAPDPPPRTATVETWGPERRVVRVSSGGASIVALDENFNVGWHGAMSGLDVAAVRLDGWRQGFVVPAGEGGPLVIDFAPGHLYRRALVVGAFLLALLAAMALAPSPDGPRADRAVELRKPRVVPVLGAVAVVALVGGPLALLLPAVLALPDRERQLPWLSGAAFGAAGVIVALDPGRFPGSGAGAFGAPVQVLAVLALAALLASGFSSRRRPR